MSLTRRDIIRGVSALAVPTITGCRSGPAHAGPRDTIEIDISGYEQVLLPREHGQLTSDPRTIRRRYPSRDHCMQMTAFLGPRRGLLVYSKDPQASIADWEVEPHRVLRIHFYGATPQVVQQEIEPSVRAAAAGYREWATSQSWAKDRSRKTEILNLISVASNPNVAGQRAHLNKIFDLVDPPVGAWFTQWRRFPFDTMYPDYVAGDARNFPLLLRELRESGRLAFPYVNGMLWDYEVGKLHVYRQASGSKFA